MKKREVKLVDSQEPKRGQIELRDSTKLSRSKPVKFRDWLTDDERPSNWREMLYGEYLPDIGPKTYLGKRIPGGNERYDTLRADIEEYSQSEPSPVPKIELVFKTWDCTICGCHALGSFLSEVSQGAMIWKATKLLRKAGWELDSGKWYCPKHKGERFLQRFLDGRVRTNGFFIEQTIEPLD